MFDIQENLRILPDQPGVYLYKDRFGEVIYVGKAVSLKNRVRQYFQSPESLTPKVRALVKDIDEFEYIITGSEMEALILENNLIKKYMPRYNVLLRDDKTYPYIKVTLDEDFPRVIKTRRVVRDGSPEWPVAVAWRRVLEARWDWDAVAAAGITMTVSAGSSASAVSAQAAKAAEPSRRTQQSRTQSSFFMMNAS